MSAVDGTPLGGRVRLLAEAQDVIVAYARHRNIEWLTDAASRYILEFAPLVEDRASLPVSPGDGREGAATATAAPSVLTLAESKALHPSSLGPVEYVKACVYCGERSQHGRCS